MRRVCAQQEPPEQLARWLVEGYWYLSDFVPGQISHPDFPRLEPAEYYQSAVKRLWDLQNPDFATRPSGERCPSAALFDSQSSKVGRGVGGLAIPLFGFCVLALLSKQVPEADHRPRLPSAGGLAKPAFGFCVVALLV